MTRRLGWWSRAAISTSTLLVLWTTLVVGPAEAGPRASRAIRPIDEPPAALARPVLRFEGVDRRPTSSAPPPSTPAASPLAPALVTWGQLGRISAAVFATETGWRPRRLAFPYDATAPPVRL